MSKQNNVIKARLPKGFRIEIQESKNFLPHNILVLINEKRQRLYVKILEKEELLKGYVFEVLTPSELKQNLNIEESYNGELYQERGFVVEESLPETPEEIEDALNKGLKKLKEKGKFKSMGEGQPVNIIIQKKISEEGERPLTVEEKRYLAKEAFKTAIREAREEEALEKAEKEDLDVRTDPPYGGAGQIPLSSAQYGKSGSREFESHEELVKYYSELSHSLDPEQAEKGKTVINALYEKFIKGLKSGQPVPINEEFKGKPITEYCERVNNRAREHAKRMRGCD